MDGGESKSFPTLFDQANKLEGPTVIVGGVSEDRTADLEREPVMLPAETNFKHSLGDVVAADSFTVTIAAADLDELQTLEVAATGGTFTLSFLGATTGALAFDAPAAEVEAALAGLAPIGTGNVQVVREGDLYFIRFVGDLARTNVGQLAPTRAA